MAAGVQLTQATIVMDQLGPDRAAQNNGTANASQDFEAANNAFDVAVIDDFTLTGAFQLDTIEAVFQGYGTAFTAAKFTDGSITGYRVEVYSSAAAALANLTGDVASVLIPSASATMSVPWVAAQPLSGGVTLTVSSIPALNLAAGTYWIGVIPVMNFTGNGQIGAKPSSFAGIPGNSNSRQVNPGGGFAIPGNVNVLNTNIALRINGTSAASIPPSLIGSSTPTGVFAGENLSLTAVVTPGENPAGSGHAVTVDLTQIGGGANVAMTDSGDNLTFTLDVVVGATPPCGNIVLPATVTDAQARSGNGNIPAQTLTPITPTPGAVPENEPACGLPTDNTNGGCNSDPDVFMNINCGDTISGTVRADAAARDTDWYQFTLTGSTVMSWTAIGQSDLVIGFIRDTANLATPPVCGSTTLAVNPAAIVTPCNCGTVSVTLGAGTWWAFVSTPFAQIPCGRTYEATLRCGGACAGDVNLDGERDGRDVHSFASSYPACFAGSVNNCTSCLAADINGDNQFTTADVTELVTLLLAGDPCP